VRIEVFVQNEAGSTLKNYHDEKTLAFRFAKTVSRPYPFPYGFLLGTTADDGCNLDCYIITRRPLKTGAIVECEAVGLMEQIEDGVEDNNVLATVPGEYADIGRETQGTLIDFVQNVFDHIPGKQIRAGRFLPLGEAEAYIKSRVEGPARPAGA
jgi:inorganic pyrophosphatase